MEGRPEEEYRVHAQERGCVRAQAESRTGKRGTEADYCVGKK